MALDSTDLVACIDSCLYQAIPPRIRFREFSPRSPDFIKQKASLAPKLLGFVAQIRIDNYQAFCAIGEQFRSTIHPGVAYAAHT